MEIWNQLQFDWDKDNLGDEATMKWLHQTINRLDQKAFQLFVFTYGSPGMEGMKNIQYTYKNIMKYS